MHSFCTLLGIFSGESSNSRVFVAFQIGDDAHTLANDLIAIRSSCDGFFWVSSNSSRLLFESLFISGLLLSSLFPLSALSTRLQKFRCHMNTKFSLISSGKSNRTNCFAVFLVALVPDSTVCTLQNEECKCEQDAYSL